MAEFDLIAALLEELGSSVEGVHTVLGPGDDCAVNDVPVGHQLVSSIDTLVGGAHFPITASADLVGFRAMCVSFSDVAAMGAGAAFATLAVTLPDGDEIWLRGFARGVAAAAQRFGCSVAGGNLARGPLNVSVSAHGHVPAGKALYRSGAKPGDLVCVSGRIGSGAAALSRSDLTAPIALDALLALGPEDSRYPLRRYYAPEPDFALAAHLRGIAHAAIDVSDGLLADLNHLCEAGRVRGSAGAVDALDALGVTLDTDQIPRQAETQDPFTAGDDYVLCFALPAAALEGLQAAFPQVAAVGSFTAERGIRNRDGAVLDANGFDHFGSSESA